MCESALLSLPSSGLWYKSVTNQELHERVSNRMLTADHYRVAGVINSDLGSAPLVLFYKAQHATLQ